MSVQPPAPLSSMNGTPTRRLSDRPFQTLAHLVTRPRARPTVELTAGRLADLRGGSGLQTMEDFIP